jgi:hypothetical protein
MNFFSNFFHQINKESVLFIDISAGSVAGAYVHYKNGETPAVLYTRRLPIEVREGEPYERAMIRALEILGSLLIREGAPVLARYSGIGSVNTILVSVEAPWQETKVHNEQFERKVPFIFTKKMVATVLEKTIVAQPGKLIADKSIIGTVLNGYHVSEPYGKKAHRASIVVLTSLIDEKISKSIVTTLQSLFHTKNILSIAGNSLRYQAMHIVFPHERSALILDAIGPLISIALVRKDFLVAVSEVSGVDINGDTSLWLKKVVGEFVGLAERYPLPRTIFLLAQESEISSMEKVLEAAELGELWLSDNPPRIVPVLASHVVGSIRQVTTASPDLPLLLMVLYWQHRTL